MCLSLNLFQSTCIFILNITGLNKGLYVFYQKGSCLVLNFKRVSFPILFVVIVILMVANPVYSQNQMTSDQQYSYWDFSRWSEFPEYTTFNPLPGKGSNCTWYAHGRLMQLGFCKYHYSEKYWTLTNSHSIIPLRVR